MLWGRINDHISYICWILQQFMNIELDISRWEGRKQSPVHVRSWSSEYDMIKAFIVGKYDEVDFRYGWLNYKANHGDPTKVLDTNWMWVIQWSKDSSSKSVTSLTGSWIATENRLKMWCSQIGTFVPSKRSLQSVKYQFSVSYYYTYNGRSLFKCSDVFVIRSKEVTIIICESVSKYWWVHIY